MKLPKRKVRVQLSVQQIGELLIALTRLEAFEKASKVPPTSLDMDVVTQLAIPLTEEEFDVIQGHFKEEAEKINSELSVLKQN